MSAYIYIITNEVNNKRYIGKSVYPIESRFKRHIKNATKGGQTKLYYEMRELGIVNFKVDLLEETTEELINEREIYYISKLKPELNGTPGGDGGSTTAGRKWITNGKNNKYMKYGVIPVGWRIGRTCKFSDPTFQKEMNNRVDRSAMDYSKFAYKMGNGKRKPVTVYGVTYESRVEAQSQLNLTKSKLYTILKNDIKNRKN